MNGIDLLLKRYNGCKQLPLHKPQKAPSVLVISTRSELAYRHACGRSPVPAAVLRGSFDMIRVIASRKRAC